MSNKKKNDKIIISGWDAFRRASTGHQPHLTGTGAHRNRRSDKKVRRQQDKRACREW